MQDVAKAVDWIEHYLDPARPNKDNDYVSHFETTIRVLGGLLSAWHLHGAHAPLLGAAIDTGMRLLCAYNNGDGLPSNVVSMGDLISQDAAWTAAVSLAEVTTLTLEFNVLAQVRPVRVTRSPRCNSDAEPSRTVHYEWMSMLECCWTAVSSSGTCHRDADCRQRAGQRLQSPSTARASACSPRPGRRPDWRPFTSAAAAARMRARQAACASVPERSRSARAATVTTSTC